MNEVLLQRARVTEKGPQPDDQPLDDQEPPLTVYDSNNNKRSVCSTMGLWAYRKSLAEKQDTLLVTVISSSGSSRLV